MPITAYTRPVHKSRAPANPIAGVTFGWIGSGFTGSVSDNHDVSFNSLKTRSEDPDVPADDVGEGMDEAVAIELTATEEDDLEGPSVELARSDFDAEKSPDDEIEADGRADGVAVGEGACD
jgi:hypothetical protein